MNALKTALSFHTKYWNHTNIHDNVTCKGCNPLTFFKKRYTAKSSSFTSDVRTKSVYLEGRYKAPGLGGGKIGTESRFSRPLNDLRSSIYHYILLIEPLAKPNVFRINGGIDFASCAVIVFPIQYSGSFTHDGTRNLPIEGRYYGAPGVPARISGRAFESRALLREISEIGVLGLRDVTRFPP